MVRQRSEYNVCFWNNANLHLVSLARKIDAILTIYDDTVDIIAYSTPAIAADFGELMSWLGASCRASPFWNRYCSCVAKNRLTYKSGKFQCYLGYELIGLDVDTSSRDGCWRQLFRNVSIATGFLVPLRWNDERGLEISVPLMVSLGDTPWADAHNDCSMLKGFSSMFVPVEQFEGSIVWHYRREKEDEFISYSDAEMSCIKRSVVTTADVTWLHQQRHFVGWTAQAQTHLGWNRMIELLMSTLTGPLGMENYPYSNIDAPMVNFVKPGMVLDKATVSGGYFVNIGISARRGQHHTPVKGPESSDYLLTLRRIKRYNVVLYDTCSKRAWLVDGASAVLHITCTQLHSTEFISDLNLLGTGLARYASNDKSSFDVLRDMKIRRSIIRRETYDGDNSEGASNGDDNVWRFEDLVALNCNYLLKIQEHQNHPPSGIDVRFTDRDRLEGWSFCDVVEQQDLMEPRMVYLQPSGRGWSDYTRRVRAITLMGRGFGDLITPASNSEVCSSWKVVPQGRDYLVTTIEILRANMRFHGGTGEFPTYIADGIRWHSAEPPFEQCQCPSTRCHPVQVLYPKTSLWVKQPQLPLQDCSSGAIIFGQCERFRLWYPKDPRCDPEMDKDGAKENRDVQMNQQTVAIAGPSQTASTAGSSSASHDNTDPDAQSSVPSRSVGSLTPATSVNPLDGTNSSRRSEDRAETDDASPGPSANAQSSLVVPTSPSVTQDTSNWFSRRLHKREKKNC